MTPADPVGFAARIGRVLDALGIRYVIGGSVASSFYGEPRSTLDLDVMIEADEVAARALADALKDEFYVDPDSVVDAVRHGSTFNAIHIASAMKVDFFIAEDRDAVRKQLDRRRRLVTSDGDVWFYAPEDIIVRSSCGFAWAARSPNASGTTLRTCCESCATAWTKHTSPRPPKIST